MSVPIAVVARAEPVKSSERTIPGGGEHAADRVGERQRHGPTHDGQAERVSGDPADVDLVAGEEEQQAEPEIGEELEELGGLQAEHLRADHDAQQHLDDDRRDEHASAAEQGRDGARDRGDADDDEEVLRIDRRRIGGEGQPRAHAATFHAGERDRIIRSGRCGRRPWLVRSTDGVAASRRADARRVATR